MDEKMDMTSGALTYSRSLSLLKEVNIQCDALKEKTTSLKKLLQELECGTMEYKKDLEIARM